MNTRLKLLSIVFLLHCWHCGLVGLHAQTSPNVVIIVSDDQGYQDLGCFGSREILTPNLDRF